MAADVGLSVTELFLECLEQFALEESPEDLDRDQIAAAVNELFGAQAAPGDEAVDVGGGT